MRRRFTIRGTGDNAIEDGAADNDDYDDDSVGGGVDICRRPLYYDRNIFFEKSFFTIKVSSLTSRF
jgi:hypothetical protein